MLLNLYYYIIVIVIWVIIMCLLMGSLKDFLMICMHSNINIKHFVIILYTCSNNNSYECAASIFNTKYNFYTNQKKIIKKNFWYMHRLSSTCFMKKNTFGMQK